MRQTFLGTTVLLAAIVACSGGQEVVGQPAAAPQGSDGVDAGAVTDADATSDASDAAPPNGMPNVDCPVPEQDSVDRSSWPEIFIGTPSQGCSDAAGSGTRAKPFCNPHKAMERVSQPAAIVTLLDGEYRLADFPTSDDGRGGVGVPGLKYTRDAHFVMRADKGAHPVILGSVRLGQGWTVTQASPRIFRLDVSQLQRDPKALYQVKDTLSNLYRDARRFRHMMVSRNGIRAHADVAMLADGSAGKAEASLTESSKNNDFTWTKANASGTACDDSNAGCFLYLRADDPSFDPKTLPFEVSQFSAVGTRAGGANYAVFDGIHTRFTQCSGPNCSLAIEGSDHVVIRGGSFAHVANSDDNSYALGLWRTNGSKVYDNEVFDSAYWGGVSNSKGITFMISGATEPNWVCRNDVHHIPGQAAVGSKGGVRQLRILGNHLHDSYMCVETDKAREQDGVAYAAGDWTIQQNVFERCNAGVHSGAQPAEPDHIINNLFVDNRAGVSLGANITPGLAIHNNVFLGGPRAACNGQECGAGLYFSNNAGEVRDLDHIFKTAAVVSTNNLFFGLTYTHGVTRNWTANYANYSLEQIKTTFGAEKDSLVADPLLGAGYRPAPNSPVIGKGLGSFYGKPSVNIGIHLE